MRKVLKNTKEEKGITLIALVVTIIVLLILAGVSINLILGDNGILKKAKDAKMDSKKAQYIEEIQLEIAEEYMERLIESKEETFIVSLQKRLGGTLAASLETSKVYAKKEWVKDTQINLSKILVIYTVEDYQILVDVDNENNTATVREDSFEPKGEACTVTFDGNGGAGSVGSISTTKGLSIELPLNGFEKTNYTFVGWYKNAQGEGERYNEKEAYQVNENETLYAKWSQHAITITYSAGTGTGTQMGNTVIEIGQKDNLSEKTYTKTGYKFAGWKDQDNNTYTDKQEITASKDLQLTAQWTPIEYTISYNLNNGTVATANPTKYTIETPTITLNNPSKDGYNFTGWTGSNGNTPQTTVKITKGTTGNKSYTANWEETEFTVSYNNNGGSGTMTSHKGTSVEIKANTFTAPYGKIFRKWNTQANGGGTDYSEGQEVTQSLNLYAIWEYVNTSDITSVMTNEPGSLASLYEKSVAKSFFTSNEGSDWTWQIFYDDDKYIFLIASNNVPNSKLPAYGNSGFTATDLIKGKQISYITGDSYKYWAGFSTDTNYNDGVFTEGTIYTAGAQSTAITNNRLTSTYLKWVSLYPNSTNKSIQAVAFMMDTSKWKKFAGNQYNVTGLKAEAIGGPTIELFVKSWNTSPKHSENQLEGYDTMTSKTNYNSYGYKIWSVGKNAWDVEGNNGDLGDSTDMWCVHEGTKGTYFYLASPSAYSATQNLLSIMREGKFCGNMLYSFLYAFRPVVSIPKDAIH